MIKTKRNKKQTFLLKSMTYTTFAVIFMCSPLKTEAGQKDYPFEIDKNYEACKFEIDVDTPGEYTATVKDPNGNETQCSAIDDTQMTCTVKNAKAGEWTVHIESDTVDDVKAVIHMSTASTKETDIVDNNISVGKDIAGLKMYFVDDTFTAEWTDENCGSVNLKVVNLDTSETIGSETVSGKKYTCDIPSGVKNISVSVVPSTSANIDGAVLTYTYTVDNHPDAEVTFPSAAKTNQDVIMAEVKLNQPYSTYVTVNGTDTGIGEQYGAGTYQIDIPVSQDGTNDIAVYIVDDKGNMRSFPYTVIKDTVPPTLKLQEAYDGLTTDQDSIIIKGTVSNYDMLAVNGEPVEPATDGYFEFECKLHDGSNEIKVVASDDAGNQTEYSIAITQSKRVKSVDPVVIATIVALIAGAILLFVKKVLPLAHKKQTKSENKTDSFAPDTLELNTVEHKKRKLPKIEKKNGFGEIMKKQRKEKGRTIRNVLNGNLIFYIFCFCAAVAVFTFILHVGYISSDSMEPTLLVHDITISNRLAYVAHNPERGDMISFKHVNDEGKTEVYGKRVIGVAGDEIRFVDGYVYINGEKSVEEYIEKDVETNCIRTFTVPEGTVFVLGDNREVSYDSRYWEEPYVQCSDIISKYMFSIPIHVFFSK